MENELELQRVNQLCLPSWDGRINSVVLRPERPEYAIRMGTPPNDNWIRVLQRLGQELKLCADVQKLAPDAEDLSLCQFVDKATIVGVWCLNLTAALQFTAVILYDQECSGSVRDLEESCPGNEEDPEPEDHCSIPQFCPGWMYNMRDIIRPLFEHMLLIDYGIEQPDDLKLDVGFICDKWPLGRCEFDDLCNALMEWAQRFPFKFCFKFARCLGALNAARPRGYTFDFADLGLMLYYYNTHRKPVSAIEYESGKTGYFGVLQELISEIPLRGSNRLQRKLSVDVNELIPKVVQNPDTRRRMISIARSIASQHKLPLEASTIKIPKPAFEMRYWEGYPWRDWRALLKAFFTSLPFFKSKKQDEEQKQHFNTDLPHS